MFSKMKVMGIAAALFMVLGITACEITLKWAVPTIIITSPSSYSSFSTNFYISGLASDGGNSIDGIYVKIGDFGDWNLVPGTSGFGMGVDKPWSYFVNVGTVGSGYKTFTFKAVAGGESSIINPVRTYYIGTGFDEVEPNNTIGTSDSVTLGILNDALMSDSDQDWFDFTVITPGTYRIETTNSTISGGSFVDTVVFLYNNVGTLITSNDNNVGWIYFSRISYDLTAGVYYYRVTGKGSYPTGAYGHKAYLIP
ncbi:MAG: hypothetical protein A2Y33_00610 [Spirochaetes bacterium GWF1_51_8]|nr:MAG: hypothetical protein A2Y33_00610 [Spirochaetes bacterium GWF1_51_8]